MLKNIVLKEQDYLDIAKLIENNDWDEEDVLIKEKYVISQFKGTAFPSDYMCYKIKVGNTFDSALLVAKKTNIIEVDILKLLKSNNFPVPGIYCVLKSKTNKILLIEQFIHGKELYFFKEDLVWVRTIKELAKIHSKFFNGNNLDLLQCEEFEKSTSYENRLTKIIKIVSTHKNWEKIAVFAFTRLKNAPKTLVHGDMFPTNILISKNEISFIDWANSCVFAYSMDVGRITSIIDSSTLKSMCPCSKKIIEEYYNEMKDMLQISYEEYLKDVYAAQFVELVWHYNPFLDNKYNIAVKEKIDELVKNL